MKLLMHFRVYLSQALPSGFYLDNFTDCGLLALSEATMTDGISDDLGGD